MLDLVRNPEDRFSHNEAHFIVRGETQDVYKALIDDHKYKMAAGMLIEGF